MSASHFSVGEVIAWRNCVRDLSRRTQPSFAIGMRVLRDEPGDLVLYRGPGYPMRIRNLKRASVEGLRHQPVLAFGDGWIGEKEWHTHDVVVSMDPHARHAISFFRVAGTQELLFWYVDLIGPATRRQHGFDFFEHGLDVVVEPDLSKWRFKDDDELEWNVAHGIYSRQEANDLYAEGERAVNELREQRLRFEAWLPWRPDPHWPAPRLPAGWDAM